MSGWMQSLSVWPRHPYLHSSWHLRQMFTLFPSSSIFSSAMKPRVSAPAPKFDPSLFQIFPVRIRSSDTGSRMISGICPLKSGSQNYGYLDDSNCSNLEKNCIVKWYVSHKNVGCWNRYECVNIFHDEFLLKNSIFWFFVFQVKKDRDEIGWWNFYFSFKRPFRHRNLNFDRFECRYFFQSIILSSQIDCRKNAMKGDYRVENLKIP